MSTEVSLVTAKARKMTAEQLRAELARILSGMSAASTPGALKRYKTRHGIMAAELTRKNLEGSAR